VYTFFVWYSPSYPLSPPPTCTSSHPSTLPGQDIFSNFVEKKEKIKKLQFCLFEVKVGTQEFSLYYFQCIITSTDSSSLFSFILP
jgi:hypothetical protein